jgi:hypothetical protein
VIDGVKLDREKKRCVSRNDRFESTTCLPFNAFTCFVDVIGSMPTKDERSIIGRVVSFHLTERAQSRVLETIRVRSLKLLQNIVIWLTGASYLFRAFPEVHKPPDSHQYCAPPEQLQAAVERKETLAETLFR